MADDERIQTPTQTASNWEGPQTVEEARCFHQGFLSGLTVYAREKGDSTLKSDNPLLKRLMEEQGWKTIETFEAVPKPDWRIGLSCKPKMRTHELYYERGKITATHPSGFGNIADKDGVLTIQMESGKVFLAPADEWITA